MTNDFGDPDEFDVDRLSDGQLDELLDGLLRAHPDLIPDPDPQQRPAADDLPAQIEVTVAPIEITPPQQPRPPQPQPADPPYAPTEAIPITRARPRAPWATPRNLGISTAAALLIIGGLFVALQGRNSADDNSIATMPETESVNDTIPPTPIDVAPTPTSTDETGDANSTAAGLSAPTATPSPTTTAPAAALPVATAEPAPSATTVPTAAPTTDTAPAATVAATATAEPTTEPTPLPSPTVAPTPSATAEPSPTPSPEPTATSEPTATPTPEPAPTVLVGANVAQVGCPYNEGYENGLVSLDTPVFGGTQTTVGGANIEGAAHVELRIRSVDQALYWIGSSWHPAAQSIFVPVGADWTFDAPLPEGTYCIVVRGRDAANGGSDRGNTIAFTLGPNQAPPIVAGGGSPNPVNLVLAPGNGATVYTSGDIRMRVAPETTSFQILDSSGAEVPLDPALLSDLLAGNRIVVPLASGDYTLIGASPSGTDTHVLRVR